MRKKYKIKKRKDSILTIFTVVIILVLVLMGTGYSLWSSKLYINGDVTLVYKEPKIENIEFVQQSNNKLITVKDSYFISALSVGDTTSFDDDTIGINATVNVSWFYTARTATVTLQFKNNNNSPLTNGTVEVLENENNLQINSQEVTEQVESQETATFTTKVYLTRSTTTSTAKYRIQYTIDDVKRYAYVILTFSK